MANNGRTHISLKYHHSGVALIKHSAETALDEQEVLCA